MADYEVVPYYGKYTGAEIDAAVGKAGTALQPEDVTDEYSSSGTAPVNGKAIASAISGKADSSDVYSKSAVDTALSGKQDSLSSAQITAINESAAIAETGDSEDRSNDIFAILTAKGECNLGEGIFYVHNLEMPVGTTLRGRGKNTIVRLKAQDVDTEQYCIRISRNNTIEGICFSGGADAPADISTVGASIGKQHGVYLVENSDGQSSEEREGSRVNMIRGCFFENFVGAGFYAENTGVGMDRGVIMSDCYITHCMAGIDIAYYSEYSKFVNCETYQCNIACINNGGNNVFVNCTFHGVKGFVIDNSNGDMTNNGHGTMVGCTINHTNNVNTSPGGGIGIEVKGVELGFLFTDCQIWFSQISVANSLGLRFSGCHIHDNNGAQVTVTGDSSVEFSSCSFNTVPRLSVTGGTRFHNCTDLANGKMVGVSAEEKFIVDNNPKNLFSTTTSGKAVGEVTFTPNADGTWTTTASKAATARRYLLLQGVQLGNLPAGRYVLSGCPAGGNVGSTIYYALYFYDITTNARVTPNNDDTGSGFTFDWTPDPTHTYGIIIDIRNGTNANGLTFKPMLCFESAWRYSDAYVQKLPTTAELYNMIKALQT